MNWVSRGTAYFASPYRVVASTRGYEAWIFSRNQSGLLGREIPSLDKAKELCQQHKESHGHP